ncbi:MAG: signal peptidase I [Candidatus Bipolaricaulis sp.]|nr:signal peptidase I [Candidatus Bipolaricaulis sp.]
MSWSSKRPKKERKPAVIVRWAWKMGWQPGRVMREVLEWIEVLVVAGALAALIMTFVTVRMHVPTGSMIPTIDPKDSFFVDRITYYFRDPKPGDIVVFRHTEEVHVKKVAESSPAAAAKVPTGVRLLYLNTEPAYSTAFLNGRFATWASGTPLQLTTADGRRYDLGTKAANAKTIADLGIQTSERRMRYVKRLIAVGGQTVQIRDGAIYVDGAKLTGERFDRFYYSDDARLRFGVEPTKVPEGFYFVLGDNSRESFDSRFWGFVDDRDMIGVPYLRVWPLTRFGTMH